MDYIRKKLTQKVLTNRNRAHHVSLSLFVFNNNKVTVIMIGHG